MMKRWQNLKNCNFFSNKLKTKKILCFYFLRFEQKYHASERPLRLKIFQQNLQQLQKLNKNSENGVAFGINKFTLMTDNELKEVSLTLKNGFCGNRIKLHQKV